MSLLTNLMENSLDAGYAEAAERRRAGEASSGGPWVFAAGMVLIGLLVAVAAAEARNRAPAVDETREALGNEIAERTAVADRLENELTELRAAVDQARADALQLTAAGTQLADQLTALETATGAGAVQGPALTVHLEDAEEAQVDGSVDPRTDDEDAQGRVTDRDLQTVVNELWAAGAEAIAVNEQRLTALSAIRSAGQAVLVDFRPLSPPYDIIAIGDTDRLQTRFVDGFGGTYLDVLETYGIEHDVGTEDAVRLPAASGLPVRRATVPEPAGGAG